EITAQPDSAPCAPPCAPQTECDPQSPAARRISARNQTREAILARCEWSRSSSSPAPARPRRSRDPRQRRPRPCRCRLPARPARCDAGALARQGDAALAAGKAKVALDAYDAALACAHDATVIPRAYAAACTARVAGKARGYFAQLPVGRQANLVAVCRTHGIEP